MYGNVKLSMNSLHFISFVFVDKYSMHKLVRAAVTTNNDDNSVDFFFNFFHLLS